MTDAEREEDDGRSPFREGNLPVQHSLSDELTCARTFVFAKKERFVEIVFVVVLRG